MYTPYIRLFKNSLNSSYSDHDKVSVGGFELALGNPVDDKSQLMVEVAPTP